MKSTRPMRCCVLDVPSPIFLKSTSSITAKALPPCARFRRFRYLRTPRWCSTLVTITSCYCKRDDRLPWLIDSFACSFFKRQEPSKPRWWFVGRPRYATARPRLSGRARPKLQNQRGEAHEGSVEGNAQISRGGNGSFGCNLCRDASARW